MPIAGIESLRLTQKVNRMEKIHTSLAVLAVAGLILGAYLIGTATETHISVIVERCPTQESIIEGSERAATHALSTGINITKPQHKPEAPR